MHTAPIAQLAGVWAMLPDRLSSIESALGRVGVEAFRSGSAGTRRPRVEPDADGIAVIDVAGAMTKHRSFLSDLLGDAVTTEITRQVQAAASDSSITAIMLRIESPGGQSAGIPELASAVRSAAAKKPVHAYVEDLGASAAYWVASQASYISANRTALIGSIGTYAVILDASKYAADLGLKVHVVKAGEFKGAGVLGTKIDKAQLEEFQRIVDGVNAEFVADFRRGRGLSQGEASRLADGRVHVGAAGVVAGLADKIESFESAMARLAAGAGGSSPRSAGTRAVSPGRAKLDAVTSFERAVKARTERGATTLDAIAAVAAEKPELHRAYLREYNSLGARRERHAEQLMQRRSIAPATAERMARDAIPR